MWSQGQDRPEASPHIVQQINQKWGLLLNYLAFSAGNQIHWLRQLMLLTCNGRHSRAMQTFCGV